MKVYTGLGDTGQTSLLSGEKVGKDDPRVKTYGALDELQAHLGMARAWSPNETRKKLLETIQRDIFRASTELASSRKISLPSVQPIAQRDIHRLEAWIDETVQTYGQPQNFIIPGNDPGSASLHVARAVARRCERLIVMLSKESNQLTFIKAYMNRVSDLLFILAWAEEVTSLVWEKIAQVLENTEDEGTEDDAS